MQRRRFRLEATEAGRWLSSQEHSYSSRGPNQTQNKVEEKEKYLRVSSNLCTCAERERESWPWFEILWDPQVPGPFSCAFKQCIVIAIWAQDDLHIHKHSKATQELQSLLCNIKLKGMLGWRACPKDVHTLIRRTSGYIAL